MKHRLLPLPAPSPIAPVMPPAFAHIAHWIFDLDNTLYPASADLFGLIDVRMRQFIERLLDCSPVEARRVQKAYFHDHGTTLAGLMTIHDVDPHDFLAFVHDIEMDALDEDKRLITAIARLPGGKYVFTNADAPYAARVLEKLGLSDAFAAVHDIHACAYRPKPEIAAYSSMIAALGVAPERSVFVEDSARNLKPAKAMGMTTVWLNNGSEFGATGAHPDFIDYEISDLGQWLHELVENGNA